MRYKAAITIGIDSDAKYKVVNNKARYKERNIKTHKKEQKSSKRAPATKLMFVKQPYSSVPHSF